ncbi:MAG: TonB-dependent receptor [Bryobacteraceae bacterium]|nr:TonB-dependent receptor [Bryobacteraceae bacterium]
MRLFRLVFFILLSFAALWAQADGNKGQILGTVSDPNGSVVPNAKVTIKNTGTGFTRELTTDADGKYRALLLDPGNYDVSSQSAGFSTATLQGIVLSVGGAASGDITLQVQSTTTTVEVGESLIQIALPQPTTNLNSIAITNLPILGRRFQDFATLTPTVQVDPQRGQLSFAGQRGVNSNVMLDGTDYNQPFFGGIRGGERSIFAFTIPQTAIQEFQTVTTGYSAEYGRSTGGILNAITKSGTNEIRGEAFYQIRHKEIGANNPILNLAPNETLQQFGGGAGGPVIRDKWFWFGAIEQQYVRVPRRVFFANLAGVQPTAATQDSLAFFGTQEEPFVQTNNATSLMARTDYQFPAGHRLTLRYQHSRNDAENAVSVGGALSPLSSNALSMEGIERNRIHGGTAQYTHLLSPNIINDVRFSTTYELRPRESNSSLPAVTVGTGGLVGRFGATSFLPTTQDDTRIQIVNGLSVNAGANTFKLGFDYNYLTTSQQFGFNQFGAFNVNGTNVATLLDILSPGGTVANRFGSVDANQYSRQVGNLLAQFNVHQIAFYAQDSWRANSHLTLDFGVRWEGQINPSPDTSNRALADRVAAATFPVGQGKLDPFSIPNALNQWMPRFGFAWTPFSGANSRRTVIRGHTGLFYAATPLLIFAGQTNNFRNPPGNVSLLITPNVQTGETLYDIFRAVGYDLNQGALSNLPVIPLDVVQRAAAYRAGTTGTVDPLTGASLDIIAPDFQNPRSYQAGLGAESEVFSNFVAGIQFNYVNTVHLQRNRDWNLPIPTARAGDQRPIFNRNARPIPTLGTFTVRESSARSMYRGMTLQAQYRVRRFQFGGNYTLSESFSDSDLERDAGGVDYENPFNLRPDYNYSRLDTRHLFNAYGVVTLPWGFEVSMLNQSRSAYPLNATVGTDANGDLQNTDRPYSAPGVPFQRNAFRNRAVTRTDLRILKNFPINDRMRLQFSAEMFNLFNNENVVFNSQTGTGTATFYGLGVDATGAQAPVDTRFRQLRLANGNYNPATTVQQGNPLQAQFGLRLFF